MADSVSIGMAGVTIKGIVRQQSANPKSKSWCSAGGETSCTLTWACARTPSFTTAETALKFLAVAALWGFTNPLLKKASAGVEKVRGDTPLRQALAEFRFLVTRWQVHAH